MGTNPTNREQDALMKIGSLPIEKAKKDVLGPRKKLPSEMQQIMYLRRKQTFIYHACDLIAQGGWPAVQDALNECQNELEVLYQTSAVECVNVYRKNNTKDSGICIILIFKIGPMEKPVGTVLAASVDVSWWQRITRMLEG